MKTELQDIEQIKELEIKEADKKFTELDKIIEKYKDKEGSLITVLHQAQKIFKFIPRIVQIHIAKKLEIPLPEVYGVVSFYSLFSMKKRGKYTIEVCTGTACYVKGCEDVLNEIKKQLDIEPGEISEDGKFTIETTRCIGACSLAPVVTIGDDTHSKVEPEQVKDIIKQYK